MRKCFFSIFLILLASFSFSEPNFFLDGYGFLSIPFSPTDSYLGELRNSLSGGANFEYRPIEKFGIDGGVSFYNFENKIQGVSSSQIIKGTVGAKGIFPLGERLSVETGVNAGVYNFDRGDLSYSGISAEALLTLDFKIYPTFSTYIGGAYTHFLHNTFKMNSTEIRAGVRINLSKAFNKQGKLSVEIVKMTPIFPALYSWYNKNPFATITLHNNEDYPITDVEISFYQEEFMTSEKKYKSIEKIKRNDFVEIDLTAFFNESILSLIEPVEKNAILKINYKLLGEKRAIDLPLSVNFLNRNNMSWADDRQAAVFVSPNDEEAKSFAKQVKAIVRDYINPDKKINAQLAMALFESLKIYGLNYVIDPTSSYAANAGSVSVDFLQFPYQTLNYRGGDCDDLSILYCSLLETLGIEGAFVTVPGHIYTAFCLGETDEEIAFGEYGILKDNLIYYEGKKWQPIEITMLKNGYNKACAFGVQEWKKYLNEALIYPIHSSWELFSSINSPESKKTISIPDADKLIIDFKNQLMYID